MTEQVGQAFLPYGQHSIDDDDVAAVAAVLRGESLTGGPLVGRFEQALCDAVGARDAVACSNGTTALHLAAMAVGVGPGTEVIVPSLTFLATANAVRQAGGEVVFADVDSRTGLLTPETLEEALSRAQAPKAVFPVHMNGQSVNMPGIAAVARRHNLSIVEDACHAVGGAYRGADETEYSVGACAHSDLACFSFHPVKTIATGEGGGVTVADPALAQHMRRLRSHGMVREPEAFVNPGEAFAPDGSPNPWYYEMSEIGYNYRLSEVNCALGLSQLSKLPGFLTKRRILADFYNQHLAPLSPAVRPVPRPVWSSSGWHLYVVHVDYASRKTTRASVMASLRKAGVGTQVHYLPVHRQPYYRERYPGLTLPGADAYYETCLTLPLFVRMTEADVVRVVAALAAVLDL